MPELSLTEFAALLERAAADEHEAMRAGLEKAGALVAENARGRVGTYEGNDWPQLADTTVEDRVRHGYAPDEPLLRTGELRDSIGHQVDGNEVAVGSDLPIANYQENGTERVPPRPFVGPAMMHEGQHAADVAIQHMLSGLLFDVES